MKIIKIYYQIFKKKMKFKRKIKLIQIKNKNLFIIFQKEILIGFFKLYKIKNNLTSKNL